VHCAWIGYIFRASECRFAKRNFELDFNVSPASRPGTRTATSSTAAKKAVENTGKITKYVFEITVGVRKTASVTRHTVYTGKPELIVGLSFLIVRQNLVCLSGRLEHVFGVGVTGVTVRMVFNGYFSVRLFYVVLGGTSGNPKDFVIICLCHRKTYSISTYLFSSSSTTS
jgi:hypothetical protein